MADLSAFSLEGKTALVTGGSTGIGQAIAIEFAKTGANVAITSHNHGATETCQAVQAFGKECLALQLDLAVISSQKVSRTFDEIESKLGQVDILVNSAGIIRRGPAHEFSDDDWQAVMAVNLDAVWKLSREAGKRMLKQGSGKIINIASLLSFQGGITVPAYTASKHAVAGLTKALANEWAPSNIQVNAIAPGYIATKVTQALRDDETRNRQILERIPAGHWGKPSEIAGAAVFLASDAASYVQGHILSVDGGWMAR